MKNSSDVPESWKHYCNKQIDLEKLIPAFQPDQVVGFNKAIIMIISQVAKDEGLRSLILRLMQGRICPQQWMMPLQNVSAYEYVSSMQTFMKQYLGSIFRKRAVELLMFVIVVSCRFQNKMPETKRKLIGFRGLSHKNCSNSQLTGLLQ